MPDTFWDNVIKLVGGVTDTVNDVYQTYQAGQAAQAAPAAPGGGGGRPRGPRQPFRLNPWEQNVAGALNVGVDQGMDPAMAVQMLLGLTEGATSRRQENVASRQQTIADLQAQALGMAQGTADMGAVQAAIGGLAESAPHLGPRAEQGIMDYVQGLYPEGGGISGLAPVDVREQYAGYGGGITTQDRQEVGQLVAQSLEKGVPFFDIRELVRRNSVAYGYDDAQTESAISEAERMYEQMTGVSLSEMRNAGDVLRGGLQNPGEEDVQLGEGLMGMLSDEQEQALNALLSSTGGDVQASLGQLAGDPRMFPGLVGDLQSAPSEGPGSSGGPSAYDWLQIFGPPGNPAQLYSMWKNRPSFLGGS